MPWLSRVAEGEEGDRCLPACTKRRPEAGREVRRERRVRRLVCVIAVGTMRGIAGGLLAGIERNGGRGEGVWEDVLSPLMFLTKICMVSHGSGEAEAERDGETIMLAWTVRSWCEMCDVM